MLPIPYYLDGFSGPGQQKTYDAFFGIVQSADEAQYGVIPSTDC
jgi:hypothetical protein